MTEVFVIILEILVGLLVSYVLARVVSAAIYRSKKEHLDSLKGAKNNGKQ